MPPIKFFGSQVGGKIVTPHSYTSDPVNLLRYDIFSAFSFYRFAPFIVWPLTPCRSGDLCELYPCLPNFCNIFLHLVLIFIQLPFICSIPFWIFFPVWSVIITVAVFWVVNQGICYILNGTKLRYTSDPKFAIPRKEHEHEQWIFLNGVAVGRHWLKSNVNRLALTFGRPVLGVHNKTNGILFDIIQCLIQRNFNYATNDIRDCYKAVKETLYKPHLAKVIFILHSQGGIEGGMIIDWLLQEVPQDLMAKLEVYTFGNAANHFNNPHLHLLSQHAALSHPATVLTTKTMTQVHFHDSITPNDNRDGEKIDSQPTTKSSRTSSSSGKTIRYIEHYAHTSDFVARWGVLHFTCNFSLSATSPRFMGRVFERQGKGHQFVQHYLDNMFPLAKSANVESGIGRTGFDGAAEEGEFMDSVVEIGRDGDEYTDEREGLEMSYYRTHEEPLGGREKEVLLRDMSPISPGTMAKAFERGRGMTNSVEIEKKMEFRVKDLSRLWLYRNGKSPKADLGIARMATI